MLWRSYSTQQAFLWLKSSNFCWTKVADRHDSEQQLNLLYIGSLLQYYLVHMILLHRVLMETIKEQEVSDLYIWSISYYRKQGVCRMPRAIGKDPKTPGKCFAERRPRQRKCRQSPLCWVFFVGYLAKSLSCATITHVKIWKKYTKNSNKILLEEAPMDQRLPAGARSW